MIETQSRQDLIEDLANREAIRDCIHRSALANDTLDAEMWKSTYWPDAHEDHGGYTGNAHEFVDVIGPAVASSMELTFHHVGNTIIRFDTGDAARATSYATIYCRMKGEEDARWDLLAGVRYIDRFERRGGEWRILDRITKTDWMREFPDSLDWSRPDPTTAQLGMRSETDPLNLLFAGTDRHRLYSGI